MSRFWHNVGYVVGVLAACLFALAMTPFFAPGRSHAPRVRHATPVQSG